MLMLSLAYQRSSKSVDEADYHRYYDGRVAVICSDLLVVLGRIYDEVRGWKMPMAVFPKYYNNTACRRILVLHSGWQGLEISTVSKAKSVEILMLSNANAKQC